MAWNPSLYLRGSSHRSRPAVDLLRSTIAALPCKPEEVTRVLDLGCGPGNLTKILTEAFPNAHIDGIDSSPEMIEAAMATRSTDEMKKRVSFRLQSVEDFVDDSQVGQKYDVIYSNATLQWLPDHKTFIPKMIQNLAKKDGGVIAMQMPDTRSQPSHELMVTAALRCGLSQKIHHVRIPRVDEDASWYFNLLTPLCKNVDIWTTEYVQQMAHAGPDKQDRHPVLDYVAATGLRPILKAVGGVDSANGKRYLEEYERLLKEEYPLSTVYNPLYKNGEFITLFPFKRFFVICQL